jgi:hypothetical protein
VLLAEGKVLRRELQTQYREVPQDEGWLRLAEVLAVATSCHFSDR